MGVFAACQALVFEYVERVKLLGSNPSGHPQVVGVRVDFFI